MNSQYRQRKSVILKGELYFRTATINGWKHLLESDAIKLEIVQSLQWLKAKGLISVNAFVIMPNHMHLIWQVHGKNGKESPQGSLLKFTAHQFRKKLLHDAPSVLKEYAVSAPNKQHEFWQRDSLAQLLYNRSFIMQKLEYLHNNPVSGKWQLADSPTAYRFSSASFYHTGVDEFGMLTNISEVL